MESQKRRLLPFPNRTILLFILTIALPAILLVFAGVRTVWQERSASEAAVRERLGRTAEALLLEFSREVRNRQEQLENLPFPMRADSQGNPYDIQLPLKEPGTGVVVEWAQDRLRATPRDQLLYRLGPIGDPPEPPSFIKDADAEDHRDQDPASRFQHYKRLLAQSQDSQIRPWLLLRLAGAARDADRHEEALQAYRELGQVPDFKLGALPAGFVAAYETCSLLRQYGPEEEFSRAVGGFYRALVEGRWQLEPVRYRWYGENARQWLVQLGSKIPDHSLLIEKEEAKDRLTKAVETLLAAWKSNSDDTSALPVTVPSGSDLYLAFWGANATRVQFHLLVLSGKSIMASVHPRLFTGSPADEVRFQLTSDDGRILFSSGDGAPPADIGSEFLVSRTMETYGSAWRADTWPSRPDEVYGQIRSRQYLYLMMLALMIASLTFGVITGIRTVRKQLEVARMKSEFVSAVSHEFRSPLTGIRQLIEILTSDKAPGENRKQQYYRMIGREAERLAHLVENVLGFTRIADRGGRYNFVLVDTISWLREVLDQFRSSTVARETTVVASISNSLPPIMADREALAGAITNLLDNAVKYSPECRTIWFEAEVEGDMVVVRVRDKGMGIPIEEQAHVFERFFRGGNSATRRIHGTGLGLSLVMEVVQAHAGRVTCESRPADGSIFTLYLKSGDSKFENELQ